MSARAVVAATGSFGRPNRPTLPGLDSFTGTLLHATEYRAPEPFARQRVVVVGAGNSAVQVATELATRARVSLTSRAPVAWLKQHPLGGKDLPFWLKVTGLDIAPLGRFQRDPATMPVIDDGRYRAALVAGAPDRRPMFTGISGPKVTWRDGTVEHVDAIVLATGYKPDLGYLAPLGALDGTGAPVTATASRSLTPGSRTWGWSGSGACPPPRCVAWAATPSASHAASPRTSPGRSGRRDPWALGSTCVNIDVCRMWMCCRWWDPRLPRPRCPAARR
ncbi:NAD(P)-binding domain-containing protein [Streptomyces sp. NBC_00259]|uniref:NAD(P)-binding domain-containing protein n=1 Tax=Streptomyces sp. NBC_00259 TaxID=2903643 RepID=UPI002E2BE39E|nr:NAD(P)-binding domain-containing protein [Streptomyces sp. NBC_00259]